MSYLGLDIGAGLTKLARCCEDTRFGPGRRPAVTMLPTAVVYEGLTSRIPAGPAEETQQPGIVRCDGFPHMLTAARSADRVPSWLNRTPAEVTQGYLRCLLDTAEPAETDGGNEPHGLVAAVPPSDRVPADPGTQAHRTAGAEMRDILAALGRPPGRLVAAPVAVLLQLRHDHPGLASVGRFIVCDVGAGGITLTLCTAGACGIRIRDTIRLTGSLAWGDDTLAAANPDDRLPTLAEILVTALASVSRRETGPAADATSVRRWRALESVLANQGQRDRMDAVLQQATAARHRHGDTVALRFADMRVTAAQLLDGCAPLADRCAVALGRLLARQSDPGWLRPGGDAGTRIVLTGGLSGLSPLRDALLAAAALDPHAPGPGVIEPDNADRLCAAARGAALVAAGAADPGDRYPHALRLPVHRSVRDRIESGHLEIAGPGSIDLQETETVFVTEDGDPVLVTIRAAAGSSGPVPLAVQIVPGGQAAAVPAVLRPAVPPRPGVYQVGVRGGADGPHIVLRRADGSQLLAYSLADLADAPPARPDEREVR